MFNYWDTVPLLYVKADFNYTYRCKTTEKNPSILTFITVYNVN